MANPRKGPPARMPTTPPKIRAVKSDADETTLSANARIRRRVLVLVAVTVLALAVAVCYGLWTDRLGDAVENEFHKPQPQDALRISTRAHNVIERRAAQRFKDCGPVLG